MAIGIALFLMPGWRPAAPELGNYLIPISLLSALPALWYRKTFKRAKENLLEQLRRSPPQAATALGILSQKMFIGETKADLLFFVGVVHAFVTGTVAFMILMAIASSALKFLFRPPHQPV